MNKFLSGVLASTLLLSTIGTSFAQENSNSTTEIEVLQEIQQETLSSGKCGANATWSFNSSTGTLTISGTGAMEDYSSGESHWNSYSSSIKFVEISEGITSIGGYAFEDCGSLISITIPNSVTKIGDWALYGCISLESLIIPNSVTSVGEYSIAACYSLTTLTIPESVTHIGFNAFSKSGMTSVTIPNSITVINDGAFRYMHFLNTVIISDSVTRIEARAFSVCDKLTSVTLPSSVTYIGQWAFGACQSLNTVYYEGSEADKAKIYVDSDNEDFLNVTWIYNSPMPSTTPEPTYPTWATTYIDFVSTKIMPDITPENCVTSSSRGLIAQSLYNMSGNNANVSATKNFNDMGTYAKAIAWCDVNNIMNGESDEYFGTNNNVTREQFALILQKVALATGKNAQTSSSSVLNSYSDVGNISTWAKDGMAWAVSNGLMSGSENKLNPQGNITGTEVAVMLYNFDKL